MSLNSTKGDILTYALKYQNKSLKSIVLYI